MLNQLEIFKNREFGEIRTVTMDGAPWFVGKDVADILGYQNGSRDINRHVDEEDRHKIMLFDGNQDKETIIINESGLYSLILSSKLAIRSRLLSNVIMVESADRTIFGSQCRPSLESMGMELWSRR